MKSGKKKVAKKKVSHEDIWNELKKLSEEFKKSNPSYPIIIPYYPQPYYPIYPYYPHYPYWEPQVTWTVTPHTIISCPSVWLGDGAVSTDSITTTNATEWTSINAGGIYAGST